MFLSPEDEAVQPSRKARRNNYSCVLRVSSRAGSVLFTGDIEKEAEWQLLEKYGNQLASDIFMVPHHGSKTSSTAGFVQAVNPEISLISVGYKNRYRLPSGKVLARYTAAGRAFLQTSNSGAISIKLTSRDGMRIEKYRGKAGKYWHHAIR